MPTLNGRIKSWQVGDISVNRNNGALIEQFYHHLQQYHPEADNIYRVTYIWNSLCWQPIYLAFIGIYQLNIAPNFTGFSQAYQSGKIAGYGVPSLIGISGSREQLISSIGRQLHAIFEDWRLELCQAYSCRPGMSNKLTADSLMVALQHVQKMQPEMTTSALLVDAKLWLSAFGLSHRFIDGFEYLQSNVNYWRTSCCQVVKVNGTTVCANCPKLKKKRDVQIKRCKS